MVTSWLHHSQVDHLLSCYVLIVEVVKITGLVMMGWISIEDMEQWEVCTFVFQCAKHTSDTEQMVRSSLVFVRSKP